MSHAYFIVKVKVKVKCIYKAHFKTTHVDQSCTITVGITIKYKTTSIYTVQVCKSSTQIRIQKLKNKSVI